MNENMLILADVWFHRYEDDGNGGKRDIEGRCRKKSISVNELHANAM